jgi:hypothetical protein
MGQERREQERNGNIAGYLWVLSLSVGLAIGAGIGAAIDRIGAGVGIGVGVGVAVGLVLYRRFESHSGDANQSDRESPPTRG